MSLDTSASSPAGSSAPPVDEAPGLSVDAGSDVRRPAIAAPVSPRPRWLAVVDQVHSSSRSPATLIADSAVLLAAAKLCGVSAYAAGGFLVQVLVAFHLARVYVPRSTLETQGVMWYPARIATPFAIISLAFAEHVYRLPPPHVDALRFSMLGFAGLVGLRVLTWLALHVARRSGRGLQPTVVVGIGPVVRAVVGKLASHPECGLLPVGILSPDGDQERGDGVGVGALPSDLPAIVQYQGVSHIVLVPEGDHDVGTTACLELCDGLDVSFSLVPPLSEMFIRPSLVAQVAGLPLIPMGKVTRSRGTLPGKRAFDLVVASLLLALTSPLLLVTALAVKLSDRGPLLYRQRRLGQGGRPFAVLKFRSMVVDADQMTLDLVDRNISDGLLFKIRDDPRVTRMGRIIRRASIDELPQLWNVIRGEMSLVGPRPLAVDLKDFGAMDGKRHSVRPGITGYWQISGGNGLTYAEMVKLDLAYIQNWSLWLDLRLLLRTIPALIYRQGYW